MSNQPSPTNWRQVEPEHAAEIDAAVDNVIAALKRLADATGDTLIDAAATGYVIARLDEWLEEHLNGHLSSQESDENLG
jgi:hypothetical protein